MKLEKGEVNLTTLSKIQSTIKAQEKVSGKKVSLELKQEVLRSVSENPERILFNLLPEAQKEILQDRKKVISEDLTRHSMTFTKEMEEDLKRVKELVSHSCPSGTDQEVIAYALKFLLNKKTQETKNKRRVSLRPSSLTRVASAAEASKSAKEVAGRAEDRMSKMGCTYKDPRSGKICGGRFQLQTDHIKPKALGGKDQPENLRILCRQHNLHAAEKVFGRKHMDRFRNMDRF